MPVRLLLCIGAFKKIIFMMIFFGFKRMKIFFKNPTFGWSLTDVSHIILFLVAIGLLFLVPYLWILPIYFSGRMLSKRKVKPNIIIPFDWNLKHFWLISFGYLFVNFAVALFFDYQETLSYLFEDSYQIDVNDDTTSGLAKSNVIFMLGMLVVTLFFFNKERLKYLYTSQLRFFRILSFVLIFMIINFTVLKFLREFVDISVFAPLNIRETIRAFISEYGIGLTFVVVAIFVPIYEEVIFRGMYLVLAKSISAFGKRTSFKQRYLP